MSKNNGRPKQAVIQEKMLGFWVTFSQYAIIEAKMKKAGMCVSDYLRQVSVQGEVKARWTDEERELIRQLINHSNQVEQLVKLAAREGPAEALILFSAYREQIDFILKTLRDDR